VTITKEQMAVYRASAQQRQRQQLEHLRQRHQLGMTVAQQATELLKQEFRVEKVVLFGSMRSPDRVHERSDVDLAVWGLNPKHYYRAVGQLQGLHPDLSVDLVEAETASPHMLRQIETTGITL